MTFEIHHMQQLAKNHPDFDLTVWFAADNVVLRAVHRTTKAADTHRISYTSLDSATIDLVRMEFANLIESVKNHLNEEG